MSKPLSKNQIAALMTDAHADAHEAYGDRYEAKIAPYAAELRKRMAEGGLSSVEALAIALDGIETPETRRDLMAAAVDCMYDAKPAATEEPVDVRPRWSKKASKWIKSIGKKTIIGDLASIPRDAVLAFACGRFRAPTVTAWEKQAGFCLLDDPLEERDGAYVEDRLKAGAIWTVGWRMDKRHVPTKRIEQEVLKAERQWLRENKADKVPAGVRSELTDRIKSAVLRATTPETTILPITIDPTSMTLIVHGSMSDKEQDALVKALRVAGFQFEHHGAEDVVDDELYGALLEANPSDLRCPQPPPTGVSAPRAGREESLPAWLHKEFLLWLWFRASSDNGCARFVHDQERPDTAWIEWWLDGTIQLESPEQHRDGDEAKPVTVTIAGSEPENAGAGLAALAEGYVPRSLRIGIKLPAPAAQDGSGGETSRETREYHATLEGWEAGSVGLPSCVTVESADDIEAAIFERLQLFGEARTALDWLWRTFCERRVDDTRWPIVHSQMREWLGLELVRRFAVDETTGQGLLFGARPAIGFST